MRKDPVPGTQSIRRTLQMMRLLAENNPTGLSLKELTEASGLERSTAHRLISCLVEECFANRDPKTRRYHVGMDAMQIGLSAIGGQTITDALRPLIMRLARLSGDTVFLVIQQGDDALCLLREHGDFPVRIFTIDQGEKRLMGIGAGGLALLADLPDTTIRAIHARHADEYEQAHCPLATIMRKVEETRQMGYSEIVSSITPGVAGVGYAFTLSRITRVAISFGAISTRLDDHKRKEMGLLLRRECQEWVRQRADAD